MKIIISPSFERQYRKLPLAVKLEAEKCFVVFKRNPRDPKLKTHKLKGSLQGYWSFSIDYQHRIVFTLGKNKTVYFYAIGDHTIYE